MKVFSNTRISVQTCLSVDAHIWEPIECCSRAFATALDNYTRLKAQVNADIGNTLPFASQKILKLNSHLELRRVVIRNEKPHLQAPINTVRPELQDALDYADSLASILELRQHVKSLGATQMFFDACSLFTQPPGNRMDVIQDSNKALMQMLKELKSVKRVYSAADAGESEDDDFESEEDEDAPVKAKAEEPWQDSYDLARQGFHRIRDNY